jgi:hypothetical protein
MLDYLPQKGTKETKEAQEIRLLPRVALPQSSAG